MRLARCLLRVYKSNLLLHLQSDSFTSRQHHHTIYLPRRASTSTLSNISSSTLPNIQSYLSPHHNHNSVQTHPSQCLLNQITTPTPPPSRKNPPTPTPSPTKSRAPHQKSSLPSSSPPLPRSALHLQPLRVKASPKTCALPDLPEEGTRAHR